MIKDKTIDEFFRNLNIKKDPFTPISKLQLLKDLHILFTKCSVECGLVAIDRNEIEVTGEQFDKYSLGFPLKIINDKFRSCNINGITFTTRYEYQNKGKGK
jgi:hypothetical protein